MTLIVYQVNRGSQRYEDVFQPDNVAKFDHELIRWLHEQAQRPLEEEMLRLLEEEARYRKGVQS